MNILGLGFPELFVLLSLVVPIVCIEIIRKLSEKKKDSSSISNSLVMDPLPAGWYINQTGSEKYRWWDGLHWTERVTNDESEVATSKVGSASPNEFAISAENVLFDYPVLKSWKTSIPFSILGLIAWIFFIGILNLWITFLLGIVLGTAGLADYASSVSSYTPIMASMVYSILVIIYAAIFYPSYFQQKPQITSIRAISFLNLFFGGVIFGCIWNSNLTGSKNSNNPNKGISAYVLIVLEAFSLLMGLINICMGMVFLSDYAPHIEQSAINDNQNAVYLSESSIETSDGLHFVDRTYGISFVLPDGWKQEDLIQDRQILQWKAQPEDGTQTMIAYGITDTGVSDYGISDIGQDELDEMMSNILENRSDETMEKVTLNSTEYWKLSESGDYSYQGNLIHTSVNQYITVKNGIVISFVWQAFGQGVNTASYYDDFLEFMDSVNYA